MYGNKLRELRKIEGWTQEEVANKLGVSKQTYSHYENEKRRPGLDIIKELANVYQVNIDDIFADEVVNDVLSLPIVNKFTLESGQLKFDSIQGYEITPKQWVSDNNFFYIIAPDDSLTAARIYPGDLLLISPEKEFKSGDIVLVMIDNKTLLRRIYKNGEQFVLHAENPNFPPIFAPPSKFEIVGKLKMNVIKY